MRFYLFCIAAALIPAAMSSAAVQTTVGYVVSVAGEAYAQAPGQEARRLACDSPVYRNDLVTTMDDPGLAIMSGDAYVRVAGNSTLRFETLGTGSPHLDLQQGHVRMIDMGHGVRTGRISTPGLVLADARSSSEAIVFREKIWTVSMVCSREDALGVERNGNSAERMVSQPGQCTISKPKEALYTAAASHEPLGLLARAQCGPRDVQLGLATRFAPGDLAGLLPAVGAGPAGLALPSVAAAAPSFTACSAGATCSITPAIFPRPAPPAPAGPAGPAGS